MPSSISRSRPLRPQFPGDVRLMIWPAVPHTGANVRSRSSGTNALYRHALGSADPEDVSGVLFAAGHPGQHLALAERQLRPRAERRHEHRAVAPMPELAPLWNSFRTAGLSRRAPGGNPSPHWPGERRANRIASHACARARCATLVSEPSFELGAARSLSAPGSVSAAAQPGRYLRGSKPEGELFSPLRSRVMTGK